MRLIILYVWSTLRTKYAHLTGSLLTTLRNIAKATFPLYDRQKLQNSQLIEDCSLSIIHSQILNSQLESFKQTLE